MKLRIIVLLCAIAALVWLIGRRAAWADPGIAFLGDSITQGWSYPQANFGIYGQTTAQMLEREPAILSTHRFRTIVIMGGTNDTLLHLQPSQTIRNLEQLAQNASMQHVRPVLCEIPPIFHSYNLKDKIDYMPSVIILNRQIAALAAAHGWTLVDYYTPLANHPGASADGVHMKRRGYLLMEVALLRRLY